MRTGKQFLLGKFVTIATGLLLLAPAVLCQSCALCYTQAASSGSRMIQALRSGILVLIVPPTLMWLVIFLIMYMKRNQHKHAGTTPDSDW